MNLLDKIFGLPLIEVGHTSLYVSRILARKIQKEWDLFVTSALMCEYRLMYQNNLNNYKVSVCQYGKGELFMIYFSKSNYFEFDEIQIKSITGTTIHSTYGKQNPVKLLRLAREKMLVDPQYEFSARDII